MLDQCWANVVCGEPTLTFKALNLFYEDLAGQSFFFQFEIIITVLVSSLRFI